MAYNPNILRQALQARHLTSANLSHRLGIDSDELGRELRRQPEPKSGLLKSVARELSLPAFAFYMEELPALQEAIPDFRSSNPAPSAKARETLESIQFAEGVQQTLVELDGPGVTNLPRFTATTDDEIDRFALTVRGYFEISLEDQRDAKDARAFYVTVRKKIEDKNITVLQDSFPWEDGSGFCLAHATHPIVLINTKKQTRARRLFTLCHELAHVLIGQSGISDPFVRKNNVERRCNRFAASFLLPQGYVAILLGTAVTRAPDPDDVRWASRKLKISQEATVLRLEQLGLYKSGTHESWRAIVHNNNPDFSEKGGGGKEPPPQEKVKLARYGFHFARALSSALDQGRISEINLYRVSGLKPKYQRSYFDFVNSISDDELGSLELDDG